MAAAQPPEGPTLVVGVGASAGGVEALKSLFRTLPPSLDAAFLVVLHLAESGMSVLPDIIGRTTELAVAPAVDGDPIRTGHVYVAGPNRHLLVDAGHIALSQGPPENGHRPAVDPTFRAIATAYGDRAVGIVLSGARDDGTLGLQHIEVAGGAALVEAPEEALYNSMPRNAAARVNTAAVLPIGAMAAALRDLSAASRIAS